MANFLIKISTSLSLIASLLLLLSTFENSQVSALANISAPSSTNDTNIDNALQYAEEDGSDDDDEEDFYVLDKAPQTNVRSSSRFLASYIIKKGTQCHPKNYNVCNGVPANKGKSILYCCKTHCRNVLGDRNNCGRCGHKCKFDERCCNGRCTEVLINTKNCGKCGKRCKAGVACDNGYCGYA
ncbi:protein GRIM REAPER-like [Humulus lupulus]|uniref:protein GRIM REAPER-like n=1 Tax=Humulus lupulus TaxID=3486 RepID=UPI002B40CB21|nr:protein GRIM REAPER-like [Humulus lupulus]